MEKVIALLKEKNHFLEKFYALNEYELMSLSEGCFDNIEAFYHARDRILDLIRSLDGLIAVEQSTCTSHIRHKSELDHIFKSRDEIVAMIVSQDLQVISYIESEKSKIIRELRETGKAKRAVGAYANVERMKELEAGND